MQINFPMILTWLRIIIVPIIIGIYYIPANYCNNIDKDILATSAFVFASLTDCLDGWLARLLKKTSSFGAFLDPVADKLIVCSSLIMLLHLGRISPFISLIIIGREIIISSLREWIAKIDYGNSIAVHRLGKIKTIFQMLAISCLLCNKQIINMDSNQIGNVLIIIAAILTIWSMLFYLKQALPILRNK